LSDGIKWGVLAGILIAVAVVIIGANYGINLLIAQEGQGVQYVNSFLNTMAGALYTARGLINSFTIPWLTSSMINVSLFMWGVHAAISAASWVAHFIYK
jgi:hypothetical protein